MDREEFELQGKLQVKVGRTLLRAKLIMLGNAMLVAWAMSLALLLIWYGVYTYAGLDLMSKLTAAPFGLTILQFQKLNIVAMTAWKLAAYLLLLGPGIGFRVAGEAMKP